MFEYNTPLRIQPAIIAEELLKLEADYHKIDPSGNLRKETKKKTGVDDPFAHEARSAFSRWNNMKAFYLRLTHDPSMKADEFIPILKKYDDGSLLINMNAHAVGNSTRIYFKPSVTSLSKEVRKAIIPVDDDKVFIYTDLKAAEFALRAYQAGDTDALDVYQNSGDIYMHFKDLFPEGTPRDVIKTCLIANMYGQTPYSVAKRVGITDTQAERLLAALESRMMKFTMLKRRIVNQARRDGFYSCPDGFDMQHLVKVADTKLGQFDPNMAWSAFTQSALGLCMQKFTNDFLAHQKDIQATFLSVFDSVVIEIKPESIDRFKEYFSKYWKPLRPDEFKTGHTMYEAMYE